ncbi:MAG TPA: hypothetical protein PLI70_10475, partial [Gemmatimonadales bacterium]|nr:hypothetical protein [Gemmatimonadales bacterium]
MPFRPCPGEKVPPALDGGDLTAERDGHHDLEVMVGAEPEGFFIVPVAAVDDNTGGDTEPGGNIHG